MKIALVTCEEKAGGTADDHILRDELTRRGHEVHAPIWSQSSQWNNFDLALLRSPWDYYKRLPEFLQWASATSKQTRLINPLETIRENAHKEYLLDLGQRGLPVVPSFIAQDAPTALTAARKMLKKSPVVIKPAVSGGSYLTYLIHKEQELEEFIKNVIAQSEAMLQPFMPSIPADGEVSLIYFRVGAQWKFSHSLLKTAAQGDFRVQQKHRGALHEYAPGKKVLQLAEAILKDLSPADLYIRIDLVDWKTDPKIGELELIEPELFFRLSPKAAPLLADALENA